MNAQVDSTEVSRLYRICGLVLASEIDLPELMPVTGSNPRHNPDIRVRVGNAAPHPNLPSKWDLIVSLPNGAAWLACARERGGYRLRFPGLADFRVDSRGGAIICESVEGTPPETTRHLLLDQVIPRTLSLLGIEALHATAVLTPYGVCAFAGVTGAGKSTLAASFHLAGHPVLSDDCLVIREEAGAILATPAYPGVRLWDDAAAALCGDPQNLPKVSHYSSKRRILADFRDDSGAGDRNALVRIYNLVDAPEFETDSGAAGGIIEALSGREAFMSLVTSTFPLDITDRRVLARQFDFFERVASRVPVRRLRIPADFSALPAIREAVLADLRSTGTCLSRAA